MSFNPRRKNPTNIDHRAYQTKVRDLSDAALRYAMRDAAAAIKAHPTGHKAGYYQDEIHYCSAELRRRQGPKKNPRRKGRRIRVDEAASRLAWWRHHRNPTSRDLSKVIQALNNPRRRRSRK